VVFENHTFMIFVLQRFGKLSLGWGLNGWTLLGLIGLALRVSNKFFASNIAPFLF
jgi:hypothetical protein